MKYNIDSKWLNKGQVCQRLGGINYTTLNYLISENNFPQGFKAKVVRFVKWYIPAIEAWERKQFNIFHQEEISTKETKIFCPKNSSSEIDNRYDNHHLDIIHFYELEIQGMKNRICSLNKRYRKTGTL